MPPNSEDRRQTSFPELKYPSLRDEKLKTSDQWLRGKSLDDGAEGLWRVHDKLYDFSDFVKRHPGGEGWLRWTKGTDITEAFECHHISKTPEAMLKNFYVRDATEKRNSPFTFDENGFYKTLKRRVAEEMKDIPVDVLSRKSERIIEMLGVATFACSIAACCMSSNVAKIVWCMAASLFMVWTVICAHNFTHKKDNWRMYFYNFNFVPSRVWRVTHVLSHHLYTNTLQDYEISTFEPIFIWMPNKTKNFINKYVAQAYAIIVYIFVSDMQILMRLVQTFKLENRMKFEMEDLVPFSLPIAMILFGNCDLLETLKLWALIWHLESFLFHFIGVNAAHHHPDIFHDGDDPKDDRDWGVHQLHAVMDRVEINGSLFRVLTNFGEHGLHHLFPTLDHAVLPELYPTFLKTCQEFNTELRMTTQLDLILGQFRQLARTDPKKKSR
ncbi:cytochrome b5-related protein-like [Arctopsyche grandis]|uniref:cytochrome b5-related protein-like n=1 Tax=Arctopsyche grandis TaxID=121162 RepID=UPI00406D99FD